MKSKTFIILTVICIILAGSAYFVLNNNVQETAEEKLGGKLFADLDLNTVAGLRIQSAEGEVNLKKGDPVWIAENRFAYPADFSKIVEFIKKMGDLKVGREFSASDETVSRLGLNGPDKPDIPDDQKGVKVVLSDKDGKNISEVIVGKAREAQSGFGGHYVKLPKESKVYLVDQNLRSIEKKVSNWLDNNIVDVKAKDIEKVVCIGPEGEKPIYTLKRPEKDKDAEFVDPPEGKKIVKSKINGLLGALSSLRLEDVADPAKDAAATGINKTKRFEFHLFDGTVYKIFPGNATEDDADKFHIKAEISYIAPPEEKPAEPPELKPEDIKPELPGEKTEDKGDGKKEEEEIKKSPAELAAEAEKLNKEVNPWTYVVSKWKYEKFTTDVEEFFEKEEETK